MADVHYSLVNEDGGFSDVSDFFTVPVISDSIVEISMNTYFDLNGPVSDSDILKYPDSIHRRLKYRFAIGDPFFPPIRLNSFSFTRQKNGDTNSSTLYYNYKTDRKVIIDCLPFIFTDVEVTRGGLLEIYAECSQSYYAYASEQLYVNYDIEVGNKRYVKQVRYSKKRYWDWRPKIR